MLRRVEAAEQPVLVAYDGSPASRQAIAETAKLLHSRPAVVVTVWEAGLAYETASLPPDGMMIAPMVEPGAALEVDRAVHDQAERVAREGADLARSLGLDAEPVAVPDEADIAHTIVRLARERGAAAIVAGSRGLGGLRARLEGSTSKGLVKHAPCPVVVVHEVHEETKH
jgi:nucleotide-binding universal stress UspA family protein